MIIKISLLIIGLITLVINIALLQIADEFQE